MMPRNPVLSLLALLAVAACAFGSFVTKAPNRLVSGEPIMLWQTGSAISLISLLLGAALLALSFFPSGRKLQIAVLTIALMTLLLLVFAAGFFAVGLSLFSPPAVRISLGWAFWTSAFCLAMILLDALQRLRAGPALRLMIVGVTIGGIAIIGATGWLDQLSLVREYAARREEFVTELARHCILVLVSVGIALAIGSPLGLWAARRRGVGHVIFSALNLLQTIPSVALFGLLIAPLSALGLGGIGLVPAITALVLYSLLPVARNVVAGIDGIEPAIVDAAAGMGLSPIQIFWRVEMPLGMPVFLAGLRIVTVQAIGLTVVAALIGAGGLGSFVFQGIGQYALDLVLLGALPTIGLALAADFLLATLAAFFEGKAR